MYMKKQKSKQNVYFILAEENLFHPKYLNSIFNKLDMNEFQIVGITIAKDKLPKGKTDFLLKMLRLWGILGFLAIGFLSKLRAIQKYDIKSLAKNHNVPYIVSDNVNSDQHISYLKEKNIDIIVSSNGQIFKKKLLNIPSIACINRHSALLPEYAGVLPVFWAMLDNKKEFGVTLHYMVEAIDEGQPIFQKRIPLNPKKSLFENYVDAFNISVDATIEALNLLYENSKISNAYKSKVNYFTFPSHSKIQEFHKHHKAFLLKDLYVYFNRKYSIQS